MEARLGGPAPPGRLRNELQQKQGDYALAVRIKELLFIFHMIARGAIKSSCVAGIGALAISLPAHALTFHWSFESNNGIPSAGGTTTGTITGLSEGSNDLSIAGITLNVLSSAQNIPLITFSSGPGDSSGFIDVLGGIVDGYVIFMDSPGRSYAFQAELNTGAIFIDNTALKADFYRGLDNIFTPASVPGPLPVLGASAAFAWTRRIRKRISLAA